MLALYRIDQHTLYSAALSISAHNQRADLPFCPHKSHSIMHEVYGGRGPQGVACTN